MLTKDNKIFFIAEIGINHNGDLNLAKKMISAAKKSGANAVKFQSFKADEFISNKKENYVLGPKKKKFNIYSLFKNLEFKKSWYPNIDKFCRRKKIEFITSVADIKSTNEYLKTRRNIIKIASEDIINYPLLKYLSRFKNKVFILSTGMANNTEIERAIKIFKKNKIILMHCVSLYPTKIKEANLNRINLLKKKYNLEVGYSDHTLGLEALEIAASMNCRIFEKHFTFDKKLDGPDHHMSINSEELRKITQKIKKILLFKGSGEIAPKKRQLMAAKKFRRSIVAIVPIKKGVKIKKEMIGLKRPSTGLHPINIKKVIGKKAKKSFRINEKIYI
jgi:sialic acid synthase SpsE